MLLKVSVAGVCVAACCVQVCRWILNQMVRGWGVTQEVLPKQAPEAAETNGKRDDIEKREKERETEKKQKKKKQKQSSAEVIQRYKCSRERQGLSFVTHNENSTNTHVG